MKLYEVFSRFKSFQYRRKIWKNVGITWFVTGRGKPVIPYKKNIIGYRPHDPSFQNAKVVLNEGFTYEEALMFMGFLQTVGEGCRSELEEIELSIAKNEYGYHNDTTDTPGFLVNCEDKFLNFPLKIMGYSLDFIITPNKK